MYSQTILIGRLTKDPESKELTFNGEKQTVTNFTLATDAGNDKADFHNIVAWRKLAETCARNLTKGRLVQVIGKNKTRSYEDKDGKRVYVTEVVADQVNFLDSKGGGNNNQGSSQGGYQPQRPQAQQQTTYQPTSAPTGFETPGLQDDDLPF